VSEKSETALVLRGGAVVVPEGDPVFADIVIRDGRIEALVAPGAEAQGQTVDVSGLTVLPGAIDAHIHLGHGNDISRPRVPSDAVTETAAAVRGGVTSVISYVISAEPYETFFDEMKGVAEAGARIDFGFHFVIATDAQLAALPRYISEFGVPTAKLFMNIRLDEGKRLGLPGIDDGFMFRLMEVLRDNGGMLCPHPENIEIGWALTRRMQEADPEGTGGLAAWNRARPSFIEAEAIRRSGYIAKVVGTQVYFVHTSSAEALAAAKAVRAEGAPVWIETCNQYLTHDVTTPKGDVGKVNPPLREAADIDALWAGIVDGSIDTVASDHVHRTAAAKAGGIWKASPGCPGLDTLLPVFLSEGHHKRGVPLRRIAELTAANPARLMGLAHRKGGIAAGLDADLAIVDLNASYQVGPDTISSDAGYSLYEGSVLKGKIIHVLSRGRFAMRDESLQDDAIGQGRYMPRRLTTTSTRI
jgi:dihydropyrimidinase